MHTYRWMFGAVLAGAALGSSALTVGTVRNPVWLEQTLDIAVPVELDAGAASGELCAKAEVFYADSMLGASQVQIAQESTQVPESVKLRITTSAPVNEPVVTVVLQVGCGQKVTRRFVLLPDVPVHLLNPAPVQQAVLAPVPLAPAAVAGSSPAQSQGPVTVAEPAASAPVAVAPGAPAVARPKPKPRLRLALRAPPPAAAAPAAAAQGPHLALEPLAALGERVRKLDETPPAPAPEPAASEPVAPQPDRLEQLQGDIQQLLKQAADNDAKLVALRVRMEQAEAERATLATALGVGGVLLVAVAALAFWLYRRQQIAARDEDAFDADLDPDAQALVVDFNPVDADQWLPPPPKAAPVPPAGSTPPAP